jgi:beta-glucosidase
VADLLGRLSLEERIALLHQFAPGVERLGVAPFRTGQEALHGVAWMGPATVFPQAVGLGASWDAGLLRAVGEAVGHEIRAKRRTDPRVGLNVWAPTVNLLRNPLWGRNEEGYSEDPAHTAALATAYTRGLRGDHPDRWRTAPVLKHWLAHNNETERDTASASVRPRVLHEYDLRAFAAPVRAGAVAGVMPAYNLVNGRPNHLSPLLADELRTWTDHPLVVCSDAGAPSNLVDSEAYFDTHEEATAAALRAGVDSFTDHGQDSSVMTGRIRGALAKGLIEEADIDAAAARLLSMRFRLGEFAPEDGPDRDPYAAAAPFDTAEHRELALRAAEAAVVLLKNDGVLPLTAPRRIAVVGPLAEECKLDWYSGTLLHRVTPLAGVRARFPDAEVRYADGADRVLLHCAGGGLTVPDAPAAAAGGDAAEGALDPALLAGRTDLPPAALGAEPTQLALTDWGDGVLTLRAPGGRYLSGAEDGLVRASAEQPGGWVVRETFRLEDHPSHPGRSDGSRILRHLATGGCLLLTEDGARVTRDDRPVDAAEATVFRLETVERGEDAVARAAAGADAVLVLAGNDPHINGRETEDRTTLALSAQQQRLWRAAHSACPDTVLVLSSSYPYAVPEAHAELPALLWTAHGGQAAGTALARILAGDVSPAGRLPQTWYARDEDLPDLMDYDIIGSRQTYLYTEARPLYAFGHGLSYAAFDYSGLSAEPDGERLRLACTVTNTGAMAAEEVAQFYVRAADPRAHPVRPHRQLIGFHRLRLAPGASERVEITVPVTELGCWDTARGRWSVPAGGYTCEAGGASDDIRLTAAVELDGDRPVPHRLGPDGLAAADYDEQRGTVLVDRGKERGDAVTPAGGSGSGGELLFHSCTAGPGVGAVELTAAGGGSVTVTALPAGSPDRPVTAGLTFGPSPDPYRYRTARAPFPLTGAAGLRITLTGELRLDRLSFTPAEPAGSAKPSAPDDDRTASREETP